MASESTRNQILRPVILPVPARVQEFKPKDRVIFLSRHARRALANPPIGAQSGRVNC